MRLAAASEGRFDIYKLSSEKQELHSGGFVAFTSHLKQGKVRFKQREARFKQDKERF